MREEHFLALLQGDGVHDALALTALQSGKDDFPFRGVDHHRHLGYLRLSRYHVEEVHHLGLGIEQSVVHVYIHHGSTICHLLAGNADGFLITFSLIRRRNFLLPATLQRSPTFTKRLASTGR